MPRISISYRRADSGAITGRIRDRLVQHYGEKSIFMDIDSIPFGADFRKNIKDALIKNDILLAIVGPRWLAAAADGPARISEEDDPVRIEIETAIKARIPVIPILVAGATMPKSNELPESLSDFPFFNAAEVDDGRDFHPHLDRLIRSIDSMAMGKSGPSRSSSRPHRSLNASRWQYVAGLLVVCVAVVAIGSFVIIGRGGREDFKAELGKDPDFAAVKGGLTRPEGTAASPARQAGTDVREAPGVIAAESGARPGGVNLLASEQGGTLLEAPDVTWRKLTSGNEEDYVETRTGVEAVYAFKDRRAGTFDTLEVLIREANIFNPKEFEILAGDDGSDGAFRSIAKCSIANKLLFETRYQRCSFPSTTAKYFKIRLLSSYHFNDWAHLPQIRLLGTLAP